MANITGYKKTLAELNELNFLFALDTTILIDQEYQKSFDTYVSVELYGTCYFDLIIEYDFNEPMYEEKEAYFYRKLETFKLLKNLSVVDEYTINGNYDDVLPLANVTINVDNFNQFKKSIRAIYLEKYSKKHPVKSDFGCFLTHFESNSVNIKPLEKKLQENSLLSRRERLAQKETDLQAKTETSKDILYRVEFTKNNEIFINEFFLKKAHFGNENAKVFRYLIENPNKLIAKDEMQKQIGSIGKDFRKIIENLGFTGNLRKIFFQISKDKSILFRNPITVKDLEDLKIPRLTLKVK